MDIIVLNRKTASFCQPNIPAIAISITDPENQEAELHEENFIAVLRLKFHDLEYSLCGYKEEVLFNEEHAKEIIQFVEKYKEQINLIMVHCEAGQSRSAGVAVALNLVINGDCGIFQQPPYYPNIQVKSTLLKEYGFYNF